MGFALSARRLQDSVGKLPKLRRMAEAEAIGLKGQSPLG